MSATPKRFAVYARVSTEGRQAEEGHSLEQQLAFAQATIDREGGVLMKQYRTAESAMGKKARPQFDAMLRDAAAGKFDALLISDETRMTRNPVDLERLREVFRAHRIELWVSGHRQDLRSSATRIGSLVKAAVSQDETNSRLDSSTRGRIQLAAMGFASGGGFPFGRSIAARLAGTKRAWETDANGEAVWKFDPEAKAYLERAAKAYLGGQSWQDVAETVTWPADTARSSNLRASAIRRRVLGAGDTWEQEFLLRGDNTPEDFDAIRNRDRVRFEGGKAIVTTPVPPLLDAATLARVRAKSSDRYLDRKQAKPHALSRLLRCGHCGSSLNIRNFPDGAIRVAHHRQTLRPECDGSFLRYEPIETSILGWLSEALKDERTIESAVRQALAAAVPDADELRGELARVQRARKDAEKTLSAARHNMLSVKLDPDEAAAMSITLATAKATITKAQDRIGAIEQRLREASVQPEHAGAIEATLKKFRRGASLLQSTLAQQRQAMKVLFGYGSLRNRPPNAKEGSPDRGVFLRWVTDPKTRERFIQWRARGQFFLLDGAVSWNEDVVFAVHKVHGWTPGALELEGVAGALRINASVHGGARAQQSVIGSAALAVPFEGFGQVGPLRKAA